MKGKIMLKYFTYILVSIAINAGVSFAGYDAESDSVAYRIVLWNNGDSGNPVTVTGQWKDLDNHGIAQHDQCRVRVTRLREGEATRWTIEVKPEPDWGVAEVRFPMLFLPKLDNDFLVAAIRVGQRIPLHLLLRGGDRLLHQSDATVEYSEFYNKPGIFSARWPDRLSMQLMTYENDREGVMIWTPDSGLWVKDFILAASDLDQDKIGKGYRAYVTHYPENTGQPGTGFASPYPVYTTPYTGGWYNAAVIYRNWGIKQWWCAKGKQYERLDTPAWWKDTHAYFGIAGRPGWALDLSEKYLSVLDGRKASGEYMNWSMHCGADENSSPEYMPPYDNAGFRKVVALQEKGLYAAPYFNFSGLTREYRSLYDKLSKGVIRSPSGSIPAIYWSPLEPDHILARESREVAPEIQEFCQSVIAYKKELKKAWDGQVDEALIQRLNLFPMSLSLREIQKQKLRASWGKDTAVVDDLKFYLSSERLCLGDELALEHCLKQVEDCVRLFELKTVYFDTFPHATLPCYSPLHNHPMGYGPHIITAQRELLKRVLRKHPGLILSCESGAGEAFLDLMHVTFYKGINPAWAIPLFPSVYNGYITYTNWWMFPPYKTDESFTSALARSVHLGYMPGGVVGGGVISQLSRELKCGADDPKVIFLRTAIDVRTKYKDYIAAGNRLCDPAVSGLDPVNLFWSEKGGKYGHDVSLLPVMASRWEHFRQKEKHLLLLSNWSDKKQVAVIDGKEYTLDLFAWMPVEVEVPADYFVNQSVPVPPENDEGKGANSPALVFFGELADIDHKARKISLRRKIVRNGKVENVLEAVTVDMDTIFSNATGLGDLNLGDKLEVEMRRGNADSPAAKIIRDLKGNKPEEG
jgi:hypothetical protein